MKNIIIFTTISILFKTLAFCQNEKFAKIINSSNQKLHFSYENKFGEIKSIWVEEFQTKDFLLENGKQRIVFEYNTNLFPCIINGGDKIFVSRLNNTYKIENCESSNPYYQLSEKFAILKTPFTGITYSKKTDFNVIINEIEKYKTNRINLIKNINNLKNSSTQDFIKIIEFRYIDELLSPLYQEKFLKNIVPASYQEKINLEIEKVLNNSINEDQLCLLKQYYWGIYKYKDSINEKNKTAKSKIEYVSTLFKNDYLRNYIIWRLYQDDFLNHDSKITYENYFRTIALDKDYIKRIDLSWK